MTSLDNTINTRGFDPTATAIAVRTIGSCYAMCYRPDSRPMIGIGLFTVRSDGSDIIFNAAARMVGDGEMPGDLLNWLEPQISDIGAIVSWDWRLAVSARLKALADPQRHPNIAAAVADTQGRWRDLPRSLTWHLSPATAPGIPCLCPPGLMAGCVAELPPELLPDRKATERQLIEEAARVWIAWANAFVASDGEAHPAGRALRALSERQARQRAGRDAPRSA